MSPTSFINFLLLSFLLWLQPFDFGWFIYIYYITYLYVSGVPIKVTNVTQGVSKSSPLEIFSYLNDVG